MKKKMRTPVETCARNASDVVILDLAAGIDRAGDPRRAIDVLNARIVECQRRGLDLPANFLRLTQTLAAECVARAS